MLRAIRLLLEMLKQKPLPSVLINVILMVRWRCFIHPFARISYPFRIQLGRNCCIGRCQIVATPDPRDSIRKTIVIGNNAYIAGDVFLASQGGLIEMGVHSTIHHYSIIYGLGGVSIGDDTRIAAANVIVSHTHVFNDRQKKIRELECIGQKVVIGSDCWIGAGARILGGVEIGDRAVVGAGSVVTKNVEAETVVAGVPAAFLSNRFKAES